MLINFSGVANTIRIPGLSLRRALQDRGASAGDEGD